MKTAHRPVRHGGPTAFRDRVFQKHKLPSLIHFLRTRCHAPGGLSRPRTQWGPDSSGVISISLCKQIWKRNRANTLTCLPWWKHETSYTTHIPERLQPYFPAQLCQLWDPGERRRHLGPGTETLFAVHRNQVFSCFHSFAYLVFSNDEILL